MTRNIMSKKIIFALSFLLVFNCDKNGTGPQSNVDIEWSGNSYSYRYGANPGGTWNIKFTVINGSGDATFKLYRDGDKKNTETVTVEEGETYKINVYICTSNCGGQGKNTLKIKTTSSNNDISLQTSCSPVTHGDMYFYHGYEGMN